LEGVGNTQGIMLLHAPSPPKTVELDGNPLPAVEHSPGEQLLRLRFGNEPRPREMRIQF
jgi:hypothetical protein